MKNLLKRAFMLGIMTALLLSKGVVSFAMETDATNISSATSENTVIENEVIIEVNSNFTGEITSEMRELGVISLEKIFDIGDTIMYLVRIENASDDVIEKLQEMSDINSAEYNQMVFTTEDEMNLDSSSIEDEILIEVESDFIGEITAEMKELGIISLEKIFDEKDVTLYLAKIENTSNDVLEKLKVLPQVKAAEYNQLVSAYQDNNTTAAATSNKGIFLPLLIVISIAIFCSILGCVFLNSVDGLQLCKKI